MSPAACDFHEGVFVLLNACLLPVITGALSRFTSLKARAWPPVLLSLGRSIHFHNYDNRWPFLAPLPTTGVATGFQTQSRILNELTYKVLQPPTTMRSGNSPRLWPSLTFAIHHLLFLSVTEPPPSLLLCHYNDTDTSCIVCVWQWMESNTMACCRQL